MMKQYSNDQPKSSRYAKDLALQRAENQVDRSTWPGAALTKYKNKNIENPTAGVEHRPPPKNNDQGMEIGPVTHSMHMPGPEMGVNLHKYMAQHGLDAAQYMGQAGSQWDAVKTPLEGRDTMTSDIKVGDHDEDDYETNDEKSINDRGRRQVGSY